MRVSPGDRPVSERPYKAEVGGSIPPAPTTETAGKRLLACPPHSGTLTCRQRITNSEAAGFAPRSGPPEGIQEAYKISLLVRAPDRLVVLKDRSANHSASSVLAAPVPIPQELPVARRSDSTARTRRTLGTPGRGQLPPPSQIHRCMRAGGLPSLRLLHRGSRKEPAQERRRPGSRCPPPRRLDVDHHP
jgi:hypothetical protein